MANNVLQAPNMSMIAPDLQAQQVALQRQQQIADMLKQQGITPIETGQMVTGAGPARAVPVTGMQALAKILQAGIGGYMQQKNDAKGLEIGEQVNERINSMGDQTLPPLTGAAPQPQMAPQGDAGSAMAEALRGSPRMMSDGSQVPNAGPTNEAAAALDEYSTNPSGGTIQPMPQQAIPAPPDMAAALRNSVKQARLMGNNDLANDLTKQAWSAYAPTEMQRSDNYLRIKPEMSRQSELAKRLKEGTQSLMPGQTNILPNGMKTVAPNFETGVAGGFDQNGNPFANEVRGSAGIAANHAGAIARAQSQNKLITVNTPNGPIMMTEEQAIQQAGGAAPQSPSNAAAPSQSGGSQVDLNNMSPKQRQAIMAQAQAQFGMQPGSSQGASIQRAPGIPLQTQADAAREVGQVNNSLAIEKSRIENAQSPEQQQKLVDANSVVDLTGQARNIMQAGNATGSMTGALRDKMASAIGISTDSSKASAQLAAIGGALVSKQPKMSGPQSDKDVLLYQQMAGRIGDSSVPLGDRLAALDVVERINKKYVQQNQGGIAGQALKANMGAGGAPAMDLSGFKVIR